MKPLQERKKSFTYDYANDDERDIKSAPLPELPIGHYEFDTGSSDEPFWEPASAKDELKQQLVDQILERDTLS